MKRKSLMIAMLCMVFAVLLTGCNNESKKEKIIIRGSTSVEPLMEILMDQFLNTTEGKNIEFDIKCEGSGKGREAAENDTVGNVIGMSSSAIKQEEADKFSQFDLAKDAVVVIVNKENALTNLSVEDVYNIYTGTTTKFEGITEDVTVVARDSASGTREAFESLIKNAEGTKLAGNMISTAEQLEKTSAVVAKVNTVKSAIGYISLGSLDDSVKALAINGVDPTVENVKNGTYILYRPFVILTNATLAQGKKLSQGVQDFLKFLQSSQAKQTIESNKYISIE
jgi:phosphate transport system substrate-binding protein